jgi:hypothetical protein
MNDKREILVELFQLIEQQIETLNGKLYPDEVVAYGRRKRKIEALVEHLSIDDNVQSS